MQKFGTIFGNCQTIVHYFALSLCRFNDFVNDIYVAIKFLCVNVKINFELMWITYIFE